MKILLFLILTPLLFAEPIRMDLSPNPVGVGDNISLIIEIPAETVSDVDLEAVEFPPGIQIWRGPYLRPFSELSPSGDPVPQVRITYTLRSLRAGRILMEPLIIKTPNAVMASEPLLIEVGTYRNRQLVFPLELEWKSSSDFIYQGEAVALSLKLLRRREIGLIDSFSVTPPRSGFWEDAPGIDSISAYALAGVPLYDIPVASYIYTPASEGRVVIAGGEAEKGGLSGRSERFEFDVMALPGEVAATGAVGQFRLTGDADVEEFREGMTFHYSLTLTGTGNLNYLKIPELLVEGAKVITRETVTSYVPSAEGYTGKVVNRYSLEVTDPSRMRVTQPAFPYIDKKSGRIRILPSQNKVFSILPALEQGEEPVEASQMESLYLPGSSVLLYFDYRRNPLLWLLLLPGPLALAIYGIFRKTRRKRTILGLMLFLSTFSLHGGEAVDWAAQMEVVQESLLTGDGDGARSELGGLPGEPYVASWHFARAVLESREANWAEAVWHLRTALANRPLNGRIREQLRLVESAAQVGDAYPPPLPLDGRLFFILLVIMINSAAVTAIFILRKPHSGWIILFILFLAGSFGMGALMGAAELGQARSFGVVSPVEPGVSAFLKRVPRQEAQEWFLLKPGTTLILREKVGEYYLAENGARVTGWIHQDQIRKVGAPDE